MKSLFTCLAAAAALLASAGAARASTIVVDSLANLDAGAMGAQTSPKCSLRYAIQAASTYQRVFGCAAGELNKTNVIQFSPALFNDGTRNPKVFSLAAPPGTPPWFVAAVTAPMTISNSLIIQGPGPDMLVIDGALQGQVFNVSSAQANTVTLSGLLISNGQYGLVNTAQLGAGGAVGVHGLMNVTVDNVVFANNLATDSGGAIHQDGNGTLTITNSIFRGNTAQKNGGGAISLLIPNYAFVNIDHTTFENNTAQMANSYGGAIRASHANLTVTNTTFDGNKAGGAPTGFGTGVSVGSGGAIDADDASMVYLTNDTFSGNTAGRIGGAIHVGAATLQITNVTIAGNRAANESGATGVGGGLVVDLGGAATMVNTLFSGNQAIPAITARTVVVELAVMPLASDCFVRPPQPGLHVAAGLLTSHGYNFVETASGCTGLVATDIMNQAAGLAPLANNGGPTQTQAIADNSRAVDAGSTTGAPTTDQRGIARDAHPDIGAFEARYRLIRK